MVRGQRSDPTGGTVDFGAIGQMSLISGAVPLVIGAIAVVALSALALSHRPRTRRSVAAHLARLAAGAGAGALVAAALMWLFIDVLDIVQVAVSVGSRTWIVIAWAGVGLAVASMVGARTGRRIVAAVAIVVFLSGGVVGVNADIGQYPTIASAMGASAVAPIPAQYLQAIAAASAPRPLWSSWEAPAPLPAAGIVGTVVIPATVSGFPARPAFVYLPPAALVNPPPALPVIVMMSGQPGSPQNVFEAGQIDRVFDTFASTHGGLAPIVVVPDQLGHAGVNPMCADAWAGDSETYLTVDVPRWIRAHLTVASPSSSWAIAGWSQGGTCAIQLGASHPEIFGNIIDISGEIAPSIGTIEFTVSRGFGGNKALYEAHRPLDIIAAHSSYSSEVAIFGWGAGDSRFGPGLVLLAGAATHGQMTVTSVISPGTAHDWSTVRFVMSHGIDPVLIHFGLVSPIA